MREIFTSVLANAPVRPLEVVVRLVLAMLLGWVVVFIYRRTRSARDAAPSFAVTLVLLSILIAMVTQVIGDNVARAFSLVGALSIVRFRTVVRDTQDTAYVIFAVAVGMAVGAGHLILASAGIVVVGIAAFVMRDRPGADNGPATYLIQVRIGLGHDPDALLAATLDSYVSSRKIAAIETAKQGLAIEITYRADLRDERSAATIVAALNRLEGVQSVSLQRVADEALIQAFERRS
jgi:uncharacterized membrane protein YhiD involved in acid resistance